MRLNASNQIKELSLELYFSSHDHKLEYVGPGKINFVFIPSKAGTFSLSTKWNGALVRSVQADVRPQQQQQSGESEGGELTGEGLIAGTSTHNLRN